MKRILLILLIVIIPAMSLGTPVHHRVKNILVNNGYWDQWSAPHVIFGGLKGFVLSNDGVQEFFYWHFGTERYPSNWKLMLINFGGDTVWEVFELGYESQWNIKQAQRDYGGKYWPNTIGDYAFSAIGCWLTLDHPWIRTILFPGKGFYIEMEWRL